MDNCFDKSLIIRIYKPVDCKSSDNRNDLLLQSIRHKLDNIKNLSLNINPNQITYGTNYLINFLILTEYNDFYQEFNIDLKTSKYLTWFSLYSKNTKIFNNLELFPIKISSQNPRINSISFKYSEPKDCYSGYYITCYDKNNRYFDATLNKATRNGFMSGECKNLISGTKYTIKSTVYHLNNEIINENLIVCTSNILIKIN